MARILVIDDQDAMRRLIRDLLPSHHHVLEACNGVQGVRLFRQEPVDLVLCDLFMPEMDGLETVRELRHHSAHAKIVAVSGGSICGRMDVLGVVRLLGADQVLRKPFDREALLAVVAEALGESVPEPAVREPAIAVDR